MAITVTPSDVRDHFHVDLDTSDVSNSVLDSYIRMARHRREDVESADSDGDLSDDRLEDMQLNLACHHLEAQFFRAKKEQGANSGATYVDGPDYLQLAMALDTTGTIKPGDESETASGFQTIDATGTRGED